MTRNLTRWYRPNDQDRGGMRISQKSQPYGCDLMGKGQRASIMVPCTHMEDKRMKGNRIFVALGILALVAGIFAAGFFIGGNSAPEVVAARQSAANSTDLRQFWNVWSLLQEKYPFADKAPTSQDKVYGAIGGLVDSYGDPYTTFFPPTQAKLFNEEVKGSFGGVGMEVGMREGIPTVIAPIKESPAAKAGIKAGDIVYKVNEVDVTDMPLDEIISMIRGEAGTTVSITVITPSEKAPRTISIVRQVINVPTIDTTLVGSDTFVISLYSFSEQSTALMERALSEFAASKRPNLVLDLRQNPGGYLEAAVEIASSFIPEGKVIVRENFGPKKSEVLYRSRGYGTVPANSHVVVLVDGGSASASEILAGALSEHGIAKLVGTKTFGKGSVQELVDLSDGSSVKITIAQWLTPNGVSISKEGLKPVITATDDPKTSAKDEALDAAIAAVRKR